MRALRPRGLLKLLVAPLVALEVTVLVTVVAGGALAAVGGEQRATFELVDRTGCRAGKVHVGVACVDRHGIDATWTVVASSARWGPAPGARASYSWEVPTTIPPAGAAIHLRIGAEALTRDPDVRMCPRVDVVGFELAGGASYLGECVDGGSSMTASRTVKLLPRRSPPGASVYLVVRLQGGPAYSYLYRAAG